MLNLKQIKVPNFVKILHGFGFKCQKKCINSKILVDA